MVGRNDFQKFYEMPGKCVKTAVSKLFEKSPLNSVIAHTSRVFNPTLIHVENKLSLAKMMKSLTQPLHMLGINSANIGDNASEQYEYFIKSSFDSISHEDGDCLDNLFFQALKIEQFPELAQTAMIIFVITYRQADVERGFSLNANVVDVNMKKQSIRSKLLVRYHMQKHNLQPATIETTNVLEKSCRAVYQRYKTYLDEEKKKAAKNKLTNRNRFLIRKLRKLKIRSAI